MKKLLLIVPLLLLMLITQAQNQVEMADSMRSNGKIYIVVVCCVMILVGLFLYTFSIDRKISRLEKES